MSVLVTSFCILWFRDPRLDYTLLSCAYHLFRLFSTIPHFYAQLVIKDGPEKLESSKEKVFSWCSKNIDVCSAAYNPSHKLLRQMRKMVLFRLATSNVKLLLETI